MDFNFDLAPSMFYQSTPSEATLKLRNEFGIDESGYPDHYKWRGLAKLGSQYTVREAWMAMDKPKPEEYYGTRVFYVMSAACGTLFFQYVYTRVNAVPLIHKIYRPLIMFSAAVSLPQYFLSRSIVRQAKKDAILLDYVDKHPERFPPVKRYKMRDALYTWTPIRQSKIT